jgi:hypothetical protein
LPVVAGRSGEILSHGESRECDARIEGVETVVELTSIKAGSAALPGGLLLLRSG